MLFVYGFLAGAAAVAVILAVFGKKLSAEEKALLAKFRNAVQSERNKVAKVVAGANGPGPIVPPPPPPAA